MAVCVLIILCPGNGYLYTFCALACNLPQMQKFPSVPFGWSLEAHHSASLKEQNWYNG